MAHPIASWLLLAAEPAPAAPPAGGGGGDAPGGMNPMYLFIVIFFIIWFVVIRPQSKEKKKREAELRAVKKNDKVITNAGIHAVVTAVGDTDVTLRIDDENDIRIHVEKSAIWQIVREPEESEDGSKDEAESKEKAAEKGKG